MNGQAPLKIVIVGAGLGGLAVAVAARLQGVEVVVLEAASKLGEVGAGIQLSPNVTRLLIRWGLGDQLRLHAVEPDAIYLRRWKTSEKIGRTVLVPNFKRDFGAPYWVIHRADLHRALLERAESLGAKICVDSRVIEVDFEEGKVHTANGAVIAGDVIVGCDGIRSVCRSRFLGASDPGPVSSPFCAYRATVSMATLSNDPDIAALIGSNDINIWLGPGRHVMTYPIQGGNTFNLVLSHPASSAPESRATDPQEILEEMKGNYAGWDPTLVKVIEAVTHATKWQLMQCGPYPSWSHPSGRFVMLGDAVHAMVPYMSQGAAAAIEDAAALALLLSEHGRQSLPDLMAGFESLRKGRSAEIQRRSALNGRVWHYSDGHDQQIRDAGMRAELSDGQFVRSTNQWSDPRTQMLVYNYDQEEVAQAYMERQRLVSDKAVKRRTCGGVEEMLEEGLIARLNC